MKYILSFIVFLNAGLLEAQPRYSVLITEIMADPSPSVGLPLFEWIEIKNNSPYPIDLKGWKIGDDHGVSGAMPSYLLSPDSFLIITTSSALNAMSLFGPAVSVSSFPSLDNDEGLIFVQNTAGSLIHAVLYSSEWYRNERKQEGGWSLEILQTNLPCAQSENWTASESGLGGSPGHTNTSSSQTVSILPRFSHVFAKSADTIILVFDRPIDSAAAANQSNFHPPAGFEILRTNNLSPLFNSVQLVLNKPMETSKLYEITINGLQDCMGNYFAEGLRIKAGLASETESRDCVINEILFNPFPGGDDYVEICNRSSKVIDLSGLAFASRNASGNLNSIQALSASPRYFFPGEYRVFTASPRTLSTFYIVKDLNQVLSVNPMPSLPDQAGTLVLLNHRGEIIDELNYSEDWHFKLLRTRDGVALERLDKNATTQSPSNWHSAATDAGSGTPGYLNSQSVFVSNDPQTISISPAIFSPDLDGNDDLLTIVYHTTSPGFVANAWIFNEKGRCVKTLVRNDVLGLSGQWTWDGLDENSMRLEPGNYILFTELFNLSGQKHRYKNLIVLARAFR